MPAGKYLYGVYDTTCYLKMVGDMKYTECAVLDDFLDEMLEEKTCNEVIIDLSDADWLDSTNLGLLAKISRYSLKNNKKKPLLFSTKFCFHSQLGTLPKKKVYFSITFYSLPFMKTSNFPHMKSSC